MRNNFWRVALAGAFALLFASGCVDTDTGKGGKTPGIKAPGPKSIKIKTWSKIEKSAKFIDEDQVNDVIVSGDGKWVYFAANMGRVLRTFNADGQANFSLNLTSDSRWKTLDITASSLDDQPGSEIIADADVVLDMRATKTGALFEVRKATNVNVFGTTYFNGDTARNGWWDTKLGGVLVNNMGREFPYLLTNLNGGETGVALGDAPAKLSNIFTREDVKSFVSFPFFANAAGKALGISQHGVSLLKGGEPVVGTNAKFSSTKIETPNVGAGLWAVEGKNFVNNQIGSVVVVNDEVILSLRGTGDYGGVARYNARTNQTIGAKPSMTKKEIWRLAVEGSGENSTVWAVTATGLIEVRPNNEAGREWNAQYVTKNAANTTYEQAKDGFAGTLMPTDQITSAAFLGEHLILTTGNDGVHVMTVASVLIPPPAKQ